MKYIRDSSEKDYEKNMPLISIIVPVFNVEKYLERCIISILKQSYTKIEVILVDDGSTDSSGKICDKYAELDQRVTIIHKENGGLSDARNCGLDKMNGQWVCFVDSDDWVTDNYIETLFHLAQKSCSEIAIGTYDIIKENENKKEDKEKHHIKEFTNYEAVENLLYQKGFTTSACVKLFDSKLFKEIRFPTGRLYEDVVTIYFILKKAKKIVYTDEILYHYFQRSTSIVRKNFNPQKMDYVKNCRTVLQDVKKSYPSLEKAAISRLLWADIHILVHMDDKKKYSAEYDLLWDDIKKYRFKVLADPKVRLINKLVMTCSYFGTDILKFLFNIKNN